MHLQQGARALLFPISVLLFGISGGGFSSKGMEPPETCGHSGAEENSGKSGSRLSCQGLLAFPRGAVLAHAIHILGALGLWSQNLGCV